MTSMDIMFGNAQKNSPFICNVTSAYLLSEFTAKLRNLLLK